MFIICGITFFVVIANYVIYILFYHDRNYYPEPEEYLDSESDESTVEENDDFHLSILIVVDTDLGKGLEGLQTIPHAIFDHTSKGYREINDHDDVSFLLNGQTVKYKQIEFPNAEASNRWTILYTKDDKSYGSKTNVASETNSAFMGTITRDSIKIGLYSAGHSDVNEAINLPNKGLYICSMFSLKSISENDFRKILTEDPLIRYIAENLYVAYSNKLLLNSVKSYENQHHMRFILNPAYD
jgi:hypothetical protein